MSSLLNGNQIAMSWTSLSSLLIESNRLVDDLLPSSLLMEPIRWTLPHPLSEWHQCCPWGSEILQAQYGQVYFLEPSLISPSFSIPLAAPVSSSTLYYEVFFGSMIFP